MTDFNVYNDWYVIAQFTACISVVIYLIWRKKKKKNNQDQLEDL